jgi:outer membrane protein insertion porin family
MVGGSWRLVERGSRPEDPPGRIAGRRKSSTPSFGSMVLLALALALPSSVPAADVVRVDALRFEGAAWIPSALLEQTVALATGSEVSQADLEAALERLRAHRWVDRADGPSVERDATGRTTAVFTVVPRRSVRRVEIEARTKEPASRVEPSLDVRRGEPLRQDAIDRDVEEISKAFASDGFLFVAVTSSTLPAPNGGAEVIYRVREGPRFRIRSVEYHGTTAFRRRELEAASGLVPERFLGILESGFYRPGAAEAALAGLRRLYERHGYIAVEVEIANTSIDMLANAVDLELRIDEGRRFELARYSISGRRTFPERLLRDRIALPTGVPYDQDEVDAAAERLRRWYVEHSDLRPRVDVVTSRSVGSEASVEFRIDENGGALIREINILGNRQTLDRVVRRDLKVTPGSPWDPAAFAASGEALRRSGLYSRLEIEYVATDTPRFRDLELSVTELAHYGWLEVGGGASSGAGEVAYVHLESANFDIFRWPRAWNDWEGAFTGGGQRIELDIIPGNRESQYGIRFVEPYFFSTATSLSIAGASQIYDRETYDETRFDASVELRRWFDADRRWSASLAYRFSNVLIDDIAADAASDVIDARGWVLIAHPRLELRYLAVDGNPYAGPAGVSAALRADIADSVTGSHLDFVRATGEVDVWVPLFDRVPDWRHSLHVGAEFGWSNDLDGGTVAIHERFFLGGPRSFRGFRYRAVGPRNGRTALGGGVLARGTVEYSFPLFIPEVRGVALFDWGAVETDSALLELDRIRTAAGGGLQLRVPVPFTQSRMPVNLYWTRALSSEAGDREQLFAFTLGFGF